MSDAATRLRSILERESTARLALKRAKATRYINLAGNGVKGSELWQLVATDSAVQELENVYEAAHIDLVAENAINWGKLDTDESSES